MRAPGGQPRPDKQAPAVSPRNVLCAVALVLGLVSGLGLAVSLMPPAKVSRFAVWARGGGGVGGKPLVPFAQQKLVNAGFLPSAPAPAHAHAISHRAT